MKWLCDGQEDCKMGEDEKNCQETGEETSHRTLTHRAALLCADSVVHNIVCIASVKNSIFCRSEKHFLFVHCELSVYSV